MKKVIFSDIDRTLAIGKTVSKENMEAIKKYISLENKFILVSGRVIPYTGNISKNIGASGYVICNNGAIVYDWLNDEIIYKKTISKETLLKMIDIANKYNARYIFGGLKVIFTNRIKYPDSEELILELTDEIYNSNPISQITISHENKEVVLNIVKEIEKLEDVYILNRHRSLYDETYPAGENIWIDITSSNVDKGYGVRKMVEYLNVDLKDTVRIGDDLNDLPMFLDEGLNVAVDNAIPLLKEKADYITSSCADNGVAKLIEKVINEEL